MPRKRQSELKDFENTIPKNNLTPTSNGYPPKRVFIPVTTGQVFTYRIYINSNNTESLQASINGYSGTVFSNKWQSTWTGNIIETGSQGYSTVTFTIPDDITMILPTLARLTTRIPDATIGTYWQKEKLEVGNVATDWLPVTVDKPVIGFSVKDVLNGSGLGDVANKLFGGK